MSQVLDAKYWADPKIMGNVELAGGETKPLQNFVWTPASSMKLFQSSQWNLSRYTLINTSSPIVMSCNYL